MVSSPELSTSFLVQATQSMQFRDDCYCKVSLGRGHNVPRLFLRRAQDRQNLQQPAGSKTVTPQAKIRLAEILGMETSLHQGPLVMDIADIAKNFQQASEVLCSESEKSSRRMLHSGKMSSSLRSDQNKTRNPTTERNLLYTNLAPTTANCLSSTARNPKAYKSNP